MVVFLIRYEASGIIQRMRELMPCFGFFSLMLMFFTISMKMFLSERSESVSLNPGVSIRVILPTLPCYTTDVTASFYLLLLNSAP